MNMNWKERIQVLFPLMVYYLFFAPSISSISIFFFLIKTISRATKGEPFGYRFPAPPPPPFSFHRNTKGKREMSIMFSFHYLLISKKLQEIIVFALFIRLLCWLYTLSYSKQSQRFTTIVIFTLGGRKGV